MTIFYAVRRWNLSTELVHRELIQFTALHVLTDVIIQT